MVRDINRRLSSIEEINEDFDLDALREKEKVTMTDIIETIKNFQGEVLQKTITASDMDAIRQQLNDVEY